MTLDELAARVEGDTRGKRAAVDSLWSGLHAVARGRGGDYSQQVGEVFRAVAVAAGVEPRSDAITSALGDVLRAMEPAERARVLREAAR